MEERGGGSLVCPASGPAAVANSSRQKAARPRAEVAKAAQEREDRQPFNEACSKEAAAAVSHLSLTVVSKLEVFISKN